MSSSPPPETPASPPRPEYMQEGLAKDDCWIMVEDEFMSTAREFTRHLHQAEYVRLRKLAKTRNASATNNITRPEGRPGLSHESKIRQRSEALTSKQMTLLEPFASDEDSSDDFWSRNPQLASLISEPRQSSYSLSQVAGIKSNTRASFGYSQPRIQGMNAIAGNTTSADFDLFETSIDMDTDLNNMPPPRKSAAVTPGPLQTSPKRTHPNLTLGARSNDLAGRGSSSRRQKTSSSPEDLKSVLTEAGTPTRPLSATEASHGIPQTSPFIKVERSPARAGSSSFAERTAKRKAEHAKKKREEKSISIDQVPTFLI